MFNKILSKDRVNGRLESDINELTKLISSMLQVSQTNVELIKDSEYYSLVDSFGFLSKHKENSLACQFMLDNALDKFIVEDVKIDNLCLFDTSEVRFYAGFLLYNTEREAIAILNIIDSEPKKLSETQIAQVQLIAEQISRRLEDRRKAITLEELRNELVYKNTQLKNFAGVVSHDMKMPLANMILICDLVKMKYENQIDDIGVEYLNKLKQSARMLSDYVTNILEHYESDRIAAMECEDFYIHDLLEEIVDFLNIQEVCDINFPEENMEIIANKSALKQILINLLTNALKYNDKERIIIDIEAYKNTDKYHFSVKDNGIGLTPRETSEIFHLFKTFGEVDRFGNLGNGIGLSTVKKLVMSLGGKIEVESEKGVYTKFKFDVEHNNQSQNRIDS